MDNTIYIALSRQLGLFRQMDAVANNVANVNTAGYKAENTVFTTYLHDAGRGNEIAFSHDMGMARNLENGSLRVTQRPLDAAIDTPNRYFAVETPAGPRYTRAGNFAINGAGQLVTAQGFPVLGAGGAPIFFAEADSDVGIDENGVITVRGLEAREERGQLQVMRFENPRDLQKMGNSLFTTNQEPIEAIAGVEYRVAQGKLEDSNVNATKEMTHMITVSRRVGSTAKMMNELHELQRNTISRIARQQ